ncbi:unnamed protein product [Rodentolepis nana]|uniref:ShKT domain-containing protein n=1 Tax=Rodentolepis nana TaxID=102285 RepID=A0A0R3TAC9_RODNA|nr:unnamed protein product [Rodentolepis nana]
MTRNTLLVFTLLALAIVASANYPHYHQQPHYQPHCPQCHHCPHHHHYPQNHDHISQRHPTSKCAEKPYLPECQIPKRYPTYARTYGECVDACNVIITKMAKIGQVLLTNDMDIYDDDDDTVQDGNGSGDKRIIMAATEDETAMGTLFRHSGCKRSNKVER